MWQTPQELYVKTVYYRDFIKLQVRKKYLKRNLAAIRHTTVDISECNFMSILD